MRLKKLNKSTPITAEYPLNNISKIIQRSYQETEKTADISQIGGQKFCYQMT